MVDHGAEGDRPQPSEAVPLREPFAAFYQRSLGPMVRLAHLLTSGSAASEELVQEAFIRVHRRWDSIEHPAAYLRTTVVHEAASHRRRAALELRRRPDPRPEAVEAPDNEVRYALAGLPYRQRAAVVLRYYLDLPEAEIATALGCRVPAVKSLLHRALEKLRQEVER
ncbi:MAG: SigE family RNA polymerase sigma factor [Actinomycetota bacterium]